MQTMVGPRNNNPREQTHHLSFEEVRAMFEGRGEAASAPPGPARNVHESPSIKQAQKPWRSLTDESRAPGIHPTAVDVSGPFKMASSTSSGKNGTVRGNRFENHEKILKLSDELIRLFTRHCNIRAWLNTEFSAFVMKHFGSNACRELLLDTDSEARMPENSAVMIVGRILGALRAVRESHNADPASAPDLALAIILVFQPFLQSLSDSFAGLTRLAALRTPLLQDLDKKATDKARQELQQLSVMEAERMQDVVEGGGSNLIQITSLSLIDGVFMMRVNMLLGQFRDVLIPFQDLFEQGTQVVQEFEALVKRGNEVQGEAEDSMKASQYRQALRIKNEDPTHNMVEEELNREGMKIQSTHEVSRRKYSENVSHEDDIKGSPAEDSVVLITDKKVIVLGRYKTTCVPVAIGPVAGAHLVEPDSDAVCDLWLALPSVKNGTHAIRLAFATGAERAIFTKAVNDAVETALEENPKLGPLRSAWTVSVNERGLLDMERKMKNMATSAAQNDQAFTQQELKKLELETREHQQQQQMLHAKTPKSTKTRRFGFGRQASSPYRNSPLVGVSKRMTPGRLFNKHVITPRKASPIASASNSPATQRQERVVTVSDDTPKGMTLRSGKTKGNTDDKLSRKSSKKTKPSKTVAQKERDGKSKKVGQVLRKVFSGKQQKRALRDVSANTPTKASKRQRKPDYGTLTSCSHVLLTNTSVPNSPIINDADKRKPDDFEVASDSPIAWLEPRDVDASVDLPDWPTEENRIQHTPTRTHLDLP